LRGLSGGEWQVGGEVVVKIILGKFSGFWGCKIGRLGFGCGFGQRGFLDRFDAVDGESHFHLAAGGINNAEDDAGGVLGDDEAGVFAAVGELDFVGEGEGRGQEED
jgi:hypothetical protein